MKKLALMIISGFMFFSLSYAQNTQSLLDLNVGNPSRDITDLLCPDGSYYSQTPDGLNGYSYIGGYYYSDNLITTPMIPITSITWWMLELSYEPGLTFNIYIQSDNGGQPGAMIASFTNLTIAGTNTGEISYDYPVYKFTYTFPYPVSLSAGDWIGIMDLPDNVHHHYWASSSDGDLYCWYGEGYSTTTDLAFCLGSTAEIPLSNWAVGIGIFLILSFALIRLRRS